MIGGYRSESHAVVVSPRMNPDLQLALELADAADAITMQHYQSTTLAVRTKIDMTPVSEADEAVERMIRERARRAQRPEDGIVGEEFGTSGSATRRWIIDPIDGTKNYVRGIPVFATLIALEENGRIDRRRRFRAGAWRGAGGRRAGEGAFCKRRDAPMHVSRIADDRGVAPRLRQHRRLRPARRRRCASSR